MGVIHIENVDEQVLNSIKLNADRHGRSFEEEVRAVLAEAADVKQSEAAPKAKSRAERFAEIRAMTKGWSPETDSTEIISELREKARTEEPPAMSPEEFAAEAARIRAMTPKGVVQTDSTEIIRELRDRGYAGR